VNIASGCSASSVDAAGTTSWNWLWLAVAVRLARRRSVVAKPLAHT
jgi:MYXO-CTERM domain-containing protein